MSIGNDIVSIRDNLILKRDGSVWALYNIPNQVINMVSSSEKEKHKLKTQAFFSGLENYADFDIAMFPFSRDLVAMYRRLGQNFSPDTEDIAKYVVTKSYQYLKERQELYEYHYFMAVPLKSYHVSVDLKETVKQSFWTVANAVSQNLGFAVSIPSDWDLGYVKQRDELEKQLRLMSAKRLTTEETIFVNRYLYLRQIEVDKAYQVATVQNHIGNLGDTSLHFDDLDVLKLVTDEGEQYVASLPVAQLPENMSYLHLMEEIQSVGFPVESFVKAKFSRTKGLPFNNVRFKGGVARGRLKNTQQESSEAGAVEQNVQSLETAI